MFNFNREAIVNVVMQLDLIESDGEDISMPISILITEDGACVVGEEVDSFPIVYPSWEVMDFFVGPVDIFQYEAKDPCIYRINLASTIAGPFISC